MGKTLELLEKYVLYATVFLVPLTILPIFPNPFSIPKTMILVFGVALAILLKAIQTLVKGSLEISTSSFDLPVVLIGAAYVVSAFLRTPNRMEAFFSPGTATVVLAAVLLYLLINQLKEVDKKNLKLVVFLSGVAFSLVSLLAASGILGKIPQLPLYMQNSSFNLLGGTLPAILFLGALLPLGLTIIFSEKEAVNKMFLGVSIGVVALGLLVSVFRALPGKETTPSLVSFGTGWIIAVDTLKESPFFGAGPANYLSAFNRFRPLSYNQTDLWALRFTSARSFYLTLLTETGLLGMAGLILLLLAVYRKVRQNIQSDLTKLKDKDLPLVVLLVLLMLFPATTSLIVLMFVFLSLSVKAHKTVLNLTAAQPLIGTESLNLKAKYTSRFPALILALPFIIAIVVFFFYSSNVLGAEIKFKKSLDALIANQGTETYTLMGEAINKNPLVDRYHASYSQISFALANSIAQNEDITDQDRNTIAQLIQQSINEAKSTVALNPQRSGNWGLLAATYRAIMPFAQGSDAFAVQTYNQAIALDPINPDLRISLGGIFYALGIYDDAIRTFELATFAKTDHANAHYNLAAAYREKGDIERAISEMSIVLSLVDRDSADYEAARAELENLEARRAAPVEAAEGETLTPPQPAEEPVIEPPLELPEDAEPPEPEVTPSPSPTPTPEE